MTQRYSGIKFSHKFQYVVAKYGSFIESIDFALAARLCKKFGFKKDDLKQFLVQLPQENTKSVKKYWTKDKKHSFLYLVKFHKYFKG